MLRCFQEKQQHRPRSIAPNRGGILLKPQEFSKPGCRNRMRQTKYLQTKTQNMHEPCKNRQLLSFAPHPLFAPPSPIVVGVGSRRKTGLLRTRSASTGVAGHGPRPSRVGSWQRLGSHEGSGEGERTGEGPGTGRLASY